MALLFFDIDGTLITLDENHQMPESTKTALRKAKEAGHKIFINTGRVKTAIDQHLLEFGFHGLVCGCGTYIEYENKVLFHQKMTKEQCLQYADLLHDLGYHTVYEGKDRLFMDGEHGPGTFLAYIYDYFSKNTQYPIMDYTSEDLIYDKFTTCEMPGCNKKGFLEAFQDSYTLIPHGSRVVEVVSKGCSKATGIQYLMDYLKVDMSQVYCFGDSINDMEMLRFVDHSVGMGNGVPDIFDVVEYKTSDIDKDGIEKALIHYGLI